MAGASDDGDGVRHSLAVLGQEIRRSNPNAVAVDVVYAFATAFFATLGARALWPAVSAAARGDRPGVSFWELTGPTLIAAVPLVVMLYFAWKSSRGFLVTNLFVVAVTAVATWMGYVPF